MVGDINALFRNHFPAYEKTTPMPLYAVKAGQRLMKCQTEELGGHAKYCKDCGYTRVWFNSCKSRFCPRCALLGNKQWLDKVHNRLLQTDHFHAIFTVPHEFNGLWQMNREKMIPLFFKVTDSSLDHFLLNEETLGAVTGKIMTLHTWTSKMLLHPHLHVLISAGGMTADNKWKGVDRNTLLNVKGLMSVFRARYVKALRKLLRDGDLNIGDAQREDIEILISKTFTKSWHVYILPKYSYGTGVINYLAHYVKGGCIKDARILSVKNDLVTLRYRADGREDGKKSAKVMHLPVNEFLRRFMQHVLPPYIRNIRYIGLYSSNQSKVLKELKAFVPAEKKPANTVKILQFNFRDIDQTVYCPHCKNPLKFSMHLKGDDLKREMLASERFKPPKVA